jgi:hypothetical protein
LADEDKQHERAEKEAKRMRWLNQQQVDRRRPENAFIRRWFKLADNILGRTDNGNKPDK